MASEAGGEQPNLELQEKSGDSVNHTSSSLPNSKEEFMNLKEQGSANINSDETFSVPSLDLNRIETEECCVSSTGTYLDNIKNDEIKTEISTSVSLGPCACSEGEVLVETPSGVQDRLLDVNNDPHYTGESRHVANQDNEGNDNNQVETNEDMIAITSDESARNHAATVLSVDELHTGGNGEVITNLSEEGNDTPKYNEKDTRNYDDSTSPQSKDEIEIEERKIEDVEETSGILVQGKDNDHEEMIDHKALMEVEDVAEVPSVPHAYGEKEHKVFNTKDDEMLAKAREHQGKEEATEVRSSSDDHINDTNELSMIETSQKEGEKEDSLLNAESHNEPKQDNLNDGIANSDTEKEVTEVSTEGDTETKEDPNGTFNENEEDCKESTRRTSLETNTNKPTYQEDDDAKVTGTEIKNYQGMEASSEVGKTDSLDQAESNEGDNTVVAGDKELGQTEETVISNTGQKEKEEIYEAKELTATCEESVCIISRDFPTRDISENVEDHDRCKENLEINENDIISEECTTKEDDVIEGARHEKEIKAETHAEVAARMKNEEANSESTYKDEEMPRAIIDDEAFKLVKDDKEKNEMDELVFPKEHEAVSKESANDTIEEEKLAMYEKNDDLGNNMPDISYSDDRPQVGSTDIEVDINKVMVDDNYVKNNVDDSIDVVGEKHDTPNNNEEELVDENSNHNTESSVHKEKGNEVVEARTTNDGYHINEDEEISKFVKEEEEASKLLVSKDELILPKAHETISQEPSDDLVLAEEKQLMCEVKNEELGSTIFDSSIDKPQIEQTDTEAHKIISPKVVDDKNIKENLDDSIDAVDENNDAPNINEELMDQNTRDNTESVVHKNEDHKVEIEITPTDNGEKENLDNSPDAVRDNNDVELMGQNNKDNTESDVHKNEDHKVDEISPTGHRDGNNADEKIFKTDIDEENASKSIAKDEMEKNKNDSLVTVKVQEETIEIKFIDDSGLVGEKEPIYDEKNEELGKKTVDRSYGDDTTQGGPTDIESHTTPTNMDDQCIKKSYDDSVDAVGETSKTPNINEEEWMIHNKIESDVHKNEDHNVKVAPTTNGDHINDDNEIPKFDIDEKTSQLMFEDDDAKNENDALSKVHEIITKESADDSVLVKDEQQPLPKEKNDQLGNDIVDFSYGDGKSQALAVDEVIANKSAVNSVLVDDEEQPVYKDRNDADNDLVFSLYSDGKIQVLPTKCDKSLKTDDNSTTEKIHDSSDAVGEKHDTHNINEKEQMDQNSKSNMESNECKDEDHNAARVAESNHGDLITENEEISRSVINEDNVSNLIIEDDVEKNETDSLILTKIPEAISKESEDASVLADEEKIPACEEKNGKVGNNEVDFSYADDRPQVGSIEAEMCDTTSLKMVNDKSIKENFDYSTDAFGGKHDAHNINEEEQIDQNDKSNMESDVHKDEDHNVAVVVTEVAYRDLINETREVESTEAEICDTTSLKMVDEKSIKQNFDDSVDAVGEKNDAHNNNEDQMDQISKSNTESDVQEGEDHNAAVEVVEINQGHLINENEKVGATNTEISDTIYAKSSDGNYINENVDDHGDAVGENYDTANINEEQRMGQNSKYSTEFDDNKDVATVKVRPISDEDHINEDEEISRSDVNEEEASKMIAKDDLDKNEKDDTMDGEKNEEIGTDMVDFSHGDFRSQSQPTDIGTSDTTFAKTAHSDGIHFDDSIDTVCEKHDYPNINEEEQIDRNRSHNTGSDVHKDEDNKVAVAIRLSSDGYHINEDEEVGQNDTETHDTISSKTGDANNIEENFNDSIDAISGKNDASSIHEEERMCKSSNDIIEPDMQKDEHHKVDIKEAPTDSRDNINADEEVGQSNTETHDNISAKKEEDNNVENFDNSIDAVNEMNDAPNISEEESLGQNSKDNKESEVHKHEDHKAEAKVATTDGGDHDNGDEISTIGEDASNLMAKDDLKKDEKDVLTPEVGQIDTETHDSIYPKTVIDSNIEQNFNSIDAVDEANDAPNTNAEERNGQNFRDDIESDLHKDEDHKIEAAVALVGSGDQINEDEKISAPEIDEEDISKLMTQDDLEKSQEDAFVVAEVSEKITKISADDQEKQPVDQKKNEEIDFSYGDDKLQQAGQTDTEIHDTISAKTVDDNNIEKNFNDFIDAANINEDERMGENSENIEYDVHKDEDNQIEADVAPASVGDHISTDEQTPMTDADEDASTLTRQDDPDKNEKDEFSISEVHETSTKEKKSVYGDQNEELDSSHDNNKLQDVQTDVETHNTIPAKIVDGNNIDEKFNDAIDAVNEKNDVPNISEEESLDQSTNDNKESEHRDEEYKVEAEVAPPGSGEHDNEDKISIIGEEDASKLMTQDDLERFEKDELTPEVSAPDIAEEDTSNLITQDDIEKNQKDAFVIPEVSETIIKVYADDQEKQSVDKEHEKFDFGDDKIQVGHTNTEIQDTVSARTVDDNNKEENNDSIDAPNINVDERMGENSKENIESDVHHLVEADVAPAITGDHTSTDEELPMTCTDEDVSTLMTQDDQEKNEKDEFVIPETSTKESADDSIHFEEEKKSVYEDQKAELDSSHYNDKLKDGQTNTETHNTVPAKIVDGNNIEENFHDSIDAANKMNDVPNIKEEESLDQNIKENKESEHRNEEYKVESEVAPTGSGDHNNEDKISIIGEGDASKLMTQVDLERFESDELTPEVGQTETETHDMISAKTVIDNNREQNFNPSIDVNETNDAPNINFEANIESDLLKEEDHKIEAGIGVQVNEDEQVSAPNIDEEDTSNLMTEDDIQKNQKDAFIVPKVSETIIKVYAGDQEKQSVDQEKGEEFDFSYGDDKLQAGQTDKEMHDTISARNVDDNNIEEHFNDSINAPNINGDERMGENSKENIESDVHKNVHHQVEADVAPAITGDHISTDEEISMTCIDEEDVSTLITQDDQEKNEKDEFFIPETSTKESADDSIHFEEEKKSVYKDQNAELHSSHYNDKLQDDQTDGETHNTVPAKIVDGNNIEENFNGSIDAANKMNDVPNIKEEESLYQHFKNDKKSEHRNEEYKVESEVASTGSGHHSNEDKISTIGEEDASKLMTQDYLVGQTETETHEMISSKTVIDDDREENFNASIDVDEANDVPNLNGEGRKGQNFEDNIKSDLHKDEDPKIEAGIGIQINEDEEISAPHIDKEDTSNLMTQDDIEKNQNDAFVVPEVSETITKVYAVDKETVDQEESEKYDFLYGDDKLQIPITCIDEEDVSTLMTQDDLEKNEKDEFVIPETSIKESADDSIHFEEEKKLVYEDQNEELDSSHYDDKLQDDQTDAETHNTIPAKIVDGNIIEENFNDSVVADNKMIDVPNISKEESLDQNFKDDKKSEHRNEEYKVESEVASTGNGHHSNEDKVGQTETETHDMISSKTVIDDDREKNFNASIDVDEANDVLNLNGEGRIGQNFEDSIKSDLHKDEDHKIEAGIGVQINEDEEISAPHIDEEDTSNLMTHGDIEKNQNDAFVVPEVSETITKVYADDQQSVDQEESEKFDFLYGDDKLQIPMTCIDEEDVSTLVIQDDPEKNEKDEFVIPETSTKESADDSIHFEEEKKSVYEDQNAELDFSHYNDKLQVGQIDDETHNTIPAKTVDGNIIYYTDAVSEKNDAPSINEEEMIDQNLTDMIEPDMHKDENHKVEAEVAIASSGVHITAYGKVGTTHTAASETADDESIKQIAAKEFSIGEHDSVRSKDNFLITGVTEEIGIASVVNVDRKKTLDDSSTTMQPDVQVKHNELSEFAVGECPQKDIEHNMENLETNAIGMIPEDGKSADNIKETEDLPEEAMSSQFAADNSVTTEEKILQLASEELNIDAQIKVPAENPNMGSNEEINKEDQYFSPEEAVKEARSAAAQEEKKDNSEEASPKILNLESARTENEQQPKLDDLPVSRFLLEKILREEDAKVEKSHDMEYEEKAQKDDIGEQHYNNSITKQDSKINIFSDEEVTKDHESRVLHEESMEKKTTNAMTKDGQTPENNAHEWSPESEVSGGSEIEPSCLQYEMSTQATSNDKNSKELDYMRNEKISEVFLERISGHDIQEDMKSLDMESNALPFINESEQDILLKESTTFEEDETFGKSPTNTEFEEQKTFSELHGDEKTSEHRGGSTDLPRTLPGDFHVEHKILGGTPEKSVSQNTEKGMLDEEEIIRIQRQFGSSNKNEEPKVPDLNEVQQFGASEQQTHEQVQVDETPLQTTIVNMHEKGTSEKEAQSKEGITESQTQNWNREIIQELKTPDEIQQFDGAEQYTQEPLKVEEEGEGTHRKGIQEGKDAHKEEKTDDEKDDKEEEDEHEQEHEESTNQPAMMVGVRDTDSKPSQKKSHNILSGMGSKVKHSLAKVKKVITGKSSHAKTVSPRQEKSPMNTV